MSTNYNRRVIGTFNDRKDAEHTLKELKDAGYSMDKVSVIARDVDRNSDMAGADISDVRDTEAAEGAQKGAVAGGALGGLTGLLIGLGAVAIPGIGPVMLGGAVATALATTLSGGAIGAAAGSLVGSLVGLGIPEDKAKVYSDRISQGDYLLIVEGSDAEIQHAQTVLSGRGIENLGIFDIPGHAGGKQVATTSGQTISGQDVVTVVDRRDGKL